MNDYCSFHYLQIESAGLLIDLYYQGQTTEDQDLITPPRARETSPTVKQAQAENNQRQTILMLALYNKNVPIYNNNLPICNKNLPIYINRNYLYET